MQKRLYGDRFSITAEPFFVKRYMKAIANRGFEKKTGHPLRYSSYQNWCPVMVEATGLAVCFGCALHTNGSTTVASDSTRLTVPR